MMYKRILRLKKGSYQCPFPSFLSFRGNWGKPSLVEIGEAVTIKAPILTFIETIEKDDHTLLCKEINGYFEHPVLLRMYPAISGLFAFLQLE